MDDATRKKQIAYRDARVTGNYEDIWQSVGKCVFCDLKDDYVLFEENGVVLTIVLFAYIDGHMMIVPRRHVRSVKELTPLEWETMRKFMYIAKKMIRDVHGIKGMQIVQKDGAEAQSTVEHLHFHTIPFDAPDLNEWKYRQLKNTPRENAELYRSKVGEMRHLAQRFDKKYSYGEL
jgi:histidine triad (HIT) family protein